MYKRIVQNVWACQKYKCFYLRRQVQLIKSVYLINYSDNWEENAVICKVKD